MSGQIVNFPEPSGRTPRAKAARMRAMVIELITSMTQYKGDLPKAFLGIAPFIPILVMKLETIEDSTWLSLIGMLETKLHFVKTGDPLA